MEVFSFERSAKLAATSFDNLSVVPVKKEKKMSGCMVFGSTELPFILASFAGLRPVTTLGASLAAAGFFGSGSTDLAGYIWIFSLLVFPVVCSSHADFSSEEGDAFRAGL